jgi:GNAT superfamily N-acetyltransferase
MPSRDPIDPPLPPDAAQLELRRAMPDDAIAVRELTRAAYAKWVPLIGREPLPMRADHDAAVRNHLVCLLFAGERLAALIETIPHDDHLLVENVAVLPSFHGRGYGRRLMAHAETLAASLGLAEMRLFTNRDFATNIRLYLGLGYEVDREGPFMNGVTVYMSKRLHSPAIEP